MNEGAWWATVHGVAKSRTRLSDFTSLAYIHMALSESENATNANQKMVGTDEAICRAGVETQTERADCGHGRRRRG